ncbi:MAG: glycosyltransferase, partial [Lactiplantibacillus plantarum]|nr:glycosyltransferase [Lactiplantibacillus plantarum]
MVKVSIIIPAYNAATTLKRAVQSVLKQTLNDFEILIVNNGS